jgi:hypothetical protein
MSFDSSTFNIVIVALLVIGFWVFFLRTNVRVANKMIMRVAQQQSVIRHNDAVRSYCRAIHLLRPDAHAGTDYIISEGGPEKGPYIAEWLNTRIPQPSDEEIEQLLNNIDDLDPAKDHAALRRKEYPSVGDQLGAAYNARHGDDTDQIRLDEQIRKVKEKYPKSVLDEHL